MKIKWKQVHSSHKIYFSNRIIIPWVSLRSTYFFKNFPEFPWVSLSFSKNGHFSRFSRFFQVVTTLWYIQIVVVIRSGCFAFWRCRSWISLKSSIQLKNLTFSKSAFTFAASFSPVPDGRFLIADLFFLVSFLNICELLLKIDRCFLTTIFLHDFFPGVRDAYFTHMPRIPFVIYARVYANKFR